MVTVELPGVGAEDLEITFQDGLLTIQGERRPAAAPPERRSTGPSAARAPSAGR